jgi:mannose-1-phosphate guanylyltransferase / mannose-6-phosphate isomerase
MQTGKIHPVVLCGGSGTRLWPLSRQNYPKQLLALTGERSLLQDTILRATGPGFAAPLVICSKDHLFLVQDQLHGAGVAGYQIVLEPVGRNTAAAATAAALLISTTDPDAIILLMPSDHVIADQPAFAQAVEAASRAASQGYLATFGITPDAPETGYGYILRGAPNAAAGCFDVTRFVEKPTRATAESYLRSGEYFWNSGIFCFAAKSFLGEMAQHEPQILEACEKAVSGINLGGGAVALDEAAFRACPSQSIDFGVMERTTKAVVVPVEMGWNDIGSWQSLWQIGPHDGSGNRVQGDVVVHGVRDSYLSTSGPLLAAVNLEDVVVVATADTVLVTRRDGSQDVKVLVEKLRAAGREQYAMHRKVQRPWGSYETVESGPGFQVKHITVKPGAKLSLQLHHKRAEHWVVVSGEALVTVGEEVSRLGENQSAFIPIETRHRLENPGPTPLHLIEVQCGTYLGEDDIVRFEDIYGRVARA